MKKAATRHSTGHYNIAQGMQIKKASQGHNMSRQSNIITRQSYPFSTSSISSGAGTSQGKISQTTFVGKGNYQSTGTPSKMKIFAQNSGSSSQNLTGGNKGTKVMVHKEKG